MSCTENEEKGTMLDELLATAVLSDKVLRN